MSDSSPPMREWTLSDITDPLLRTRTEAFKVLFPGLTIRKVHDVLLNSPVRDWNAIHSNLQQEASKSGPSATLSNEDNRPQNSQHGSTSEESATDDGTPVDWKGQKITPRDLACRMNGVKLSIKSMRTGVDNLKKSITEQLDDLVEILELTMGEAHGIQNSLHILQNYENEAGE
ncbi:hypothetical protein DPSP01_007258 [Paraphaeosphaeria sporulosa]